MGLDDLFLSAGASCMYNGRSASNASQSGQYISKCLAIELMATQVSCHSCQGLPGMELLGDGSHVSTVRVTPERKLN